MPGQHIVEPLDLSDRSFALGAKVQFERLAFRTDTEQLGWVHRHATLLLELGEHPKMVQEHLGHSTTMMNIYGHVTPTRQRAAADRFIGMNARDEAKF